MELQSMIETYLNKQQMVARSSQHVYDLLAQENGVEYVERIKTLLTQRTTEEVSTESFYDIVSRVEVHDISLYDLFASRARKAIVWNLEKICSELYRYPDSILDIGCGTGLTSCFLGIRYPRAIIEGIDISQGMIDAANKRARSLGLTNTFFSQKDFLCSLEKKYDVIIGIHSLDESCNMQTEESVRIAQLQGLLAEEGRLILIRGGMYRKEGFDYEGEISNASDFRKHLRLCIPPEIIFRFNDADGEGLEQGLTVWNKESQYGSG